MADELTPKVEPKVEPVVTPKVEPEVKVEPVVTDPKELKTQILRDLSKELGVNVFEAEGLAKVKELVESQKTEQQKLQEQLQAYEEEKARWQSTRIEYESKLKATELGIAPDKLEDALKLAGGDPEKLPEVLTKYPVFKQKGTVNIALQNPNNNTPPTDMSEVEAYMARDPRYRNYLKNKK